MDENKPKEEELTKDEKTETHDVIKEKAAMSAPKKEVDLVDEKGKQHELKQYSEPRTEEEKMDEKREKVVNFFKGLASKAKDTEEKVEDKVEAQDIDLKEQRDKVVSFVKNKWHYITYILLAAIIWFGAFIRTRNLGLLKDSVTGKYIPLALDPHVFLRYAQYLVEHGQLMVVDTMRNFPYGYYNINVMEGMAYFIAIPYKILNAIIPSITLEHVDVLTPVIAYAIAAIFFFLLVRRLFDNRTALFATLLLSIMPTFLYRTMAGFSDHDAPGMMFQFITIYLFIVAWQAKTTKGAVFFGLLSGISASLAGLVWPGGNNFLYLIFGGFILVEILLDKFEKKDFFMFVSWFLPILIILTLMTNILTFRAMFTSLTTMMMVLGLGVAIVHTLVYHYNIIKIKNFDRIPKGIISLIITVLIGIVVVSAMEGPSFIPNKVSQIYTDLMSPFGKTRWHLTVAENHQPYIMDWISQMSWAFVLMFMIGSAVLFNEMLKPLGRYARRLTPLYVLFIFAFTFSRYKNSSILNGENSLSKSLYLGSLIIFVAILIWGYLYSYYKRRDIFKDILNIDKKYTFIFLWFLFMVIAARGAARLLFVFTPITVILVSYVSVNALETSMRIKDRLWKYLLVALILIVLINPFSFAKGMVFAFSDQSLGQAKYTGPSYNQQWQNAGNWIREETPLDAVFGHWWDYGYWVQTGGERATVTDGGNNIGVWNFFMGRHALCGESQEEALDFLYAHNVSHFLIISDEIGKYTAFSSIGGGLDYERYSWITNFRRNDKETVETRDKIVYLYQGQYVFDEDFEYDGQLYAQRQAAIIGFWLPVETVEITQDNKTQKLQRIAQPEAVIANQQGQKKIPLKCVYLNGRMYKYDTEGLGGCLRIMPNLGNAQDPIGAALYVSERGINAIWTQLYLFEQNDPDFDTSAYKLAYSDESGMPLALYNGRQIGPLKIWEINYPENMTVDEKYLLRSYQGAGLEDMQNI